MSHYLKQGQRKHGSRFLCLILAALLFGAPAVRVCAQDLPYDSYSYDYWQDAVPSPSAYEPIRSISGTVAGAGTFSEPSDLFVHMDGSMYLCDSGNHRIVVLNENYETIQIIDGFLNSGQREEFLNPQGVCISETGDVYVADTGNHRIVRLSPEGDLIRIYSDPVSDALPEQYIFDPVKIGVDRAGKVYAIAKNMFEGMLNFAEDGRYLGYFGTIKVTVGPADRFWRIFMTKEQRNKARLFIPTEFTGLDIDENGFVYTTDVDYTSTRSIKKFNPGSVDILRNYNITADDAKSGRLDLIGDYQYADDGIYGGRSSLIDVEYRGRGMYSVLDSKRGRIISYDNEGNILYIFGGMGSQYGMFKKPVALEAFGDQIYVLDGGRGTIEIFRATEYGNLINKAVGLRFDGDEGAAAECWREVLKFDAGCRLAYVGIGKSLLAENKNKEAMFYLKKGMDKINYSVAFKRYRTDVMKRYFPYAAAAILAIAAGTAVRKLYRKKYNRGEVSGNESDSGGNNQTIRIRKEKGQRFSLSRYIMFHPADGFYRMKYEKEGKTWVIFFNLALFWISLSVQKQYTGFAMNPNHPMSYNILRDFLMVASVFLLWCVGNWSVTTLMNGEGSFYHIAMATAYALTPVNLVFIPAALVSNLMVYNEKEFYYLVIGIAVVWTAILLFMGIYSVHRYTVGKTAATVLLTFAAILIIVFLIGLVSALMQQVFVFLKGIYTELIYRL